LEIAIDHHSAAAPPLESLELVHKIFCQSKTFTVNESVSSEFFASHPTDSWPPSIARIPEPVASAVSASGISDQEFDALVKRARQEAWD